MMQTRSKIAHTYITMQSKIDEKPGSQNKPMWTKKENKKHAKLLFSISIIFRSEEIQRCTTDTLSMSFLPMTFSQWAWQRYRAAGTNDLDMCKTGSGTFCILASNRCFKEGALTFTVDRSLSLSSTTLLTKQVGHLPLSFCLTKLVTSQVLSSVPLKCSSSSRVQIFD